MQTIRVLGFGVLVLVLGMVMLALGQGPNPEKAKRLGLPEGTVQVSACVPGMGEHWAQPSDLPFGPIYGVMGERLVFVEIMVAQSDFAAGKSWRDLLKPLKGYAIDHVDVEFEPQGHEGYPVPHYDIHAYFVPHAEHLGYCP